MSEYPSELDPATHWVSVPVRPNPDSDWASYDSDGLRKGPESCRPWAFLFDRLAHSPKLLAPVRRTPHGPPWGTLSANSRPTSSSCRWHVADRAALIPVFFPSVPIHHMLSNRRQAFRKNKSSKEGPPSFTLEQTDIAVVDGDVLDLRKSLAGRISSKPSSVRNLLERMARKASSLNDHTRVGAAEKFARIVHMAPKRSWSPYAAAVVKNVDRAVTVAAR